MKLFRRKDRAALLAEQVERDFSALKKFEAKWYYPAVAGDVFLELGGVPELYPAGLLGLPLKIYLWRRHRSLCLRLKSSTDRLGQELEKRRELERLDRD